MRCPECVSKNLKSKLFRDTLSVSSCAPSYYYWDEDGKLHDHNCEVSTLELRCTQGHKFTHKEKVTCHCGWTP